jgi:hypothetical protein
MSFVTDPYSGLQLLDLTHPWAMAPRPTLGRKT